MKSDMKFDIDTAFNASGTFIAQSVGLNEEECR